MSKKGVGKGNRMYDGKGEEGMMRSGDDKRGKDAGTVPSLRGEAAKTERLEGGKHYHGTERDE